MSKREEDIVNKDIVLFALVHGIEVDSKTQKAICSFYKLPQINRLNISCVGYINAGGRG